MGEHPTVPGYEILRLLGRNGHLIYLARQIATDRLVQLNYVHSANSFGEYVAQSLRREAQVLGCLSHPNIVQVVEVGEAQGHGFYMAMEHFSNESVGGMASCGRRRDNNEVVRICRGIAAALDHAHARGVVHGSSTPGTYCSTSLAMSA